MPKKIIILAAAVIGLALINHTNQVTFPQPIKPAQPSQTDTPSSNTHEVLGNSTRSPQISISGGKDSYSRGGIISLASTSEPSINIGAYDVSGTAEIRLYQADTDAVFTYLMHDKEGKQTNQTVDPANFRFITTLTQGVQSGYGRESKLLLPLEDSGVWYVHIKLGEAQEQAFLMRSNTGVTTHEGDNTLIFWAQDYKTKKSIVSGEVAIYSLRDQKQELSRSFFNTEGIATLPVSAEADIALATVGSDVSLIPLNLRYLNSGYGYSTFKPKVKHTKYFIFTDRPLYRPGDTIYYKAVLRDDDDVRFSVPSEAVSVKIYREWDEKDTVYEKNLSASSEGTVFGDFKLPQSTTTGNYTLKVAIPRQKGDRDFYWEDNTVSFQVEFFRKPEYSIDITSSVSEVVAGDNVSFTINGSYFSGQPLNDRRVKYTVTSGDFYEYDYLADRSFALSDNYRYGYWGGTKVTDGQANLDSQGQAVVNLTVQAAKGKSQVLQIEAEFDDGSGNPAFARKNILVYSGEYGVYKKSYIYGGKVGDPLNLPIILVAHRGTNVAAIDLTSQVTRVAWVPYQEPDKKYPSYKKEEEKLPEIKTKTDTSGNANFSLVPQRGGSYEFAIIGKDSRGNIISKTFSMWVSREGEFYYTGEIDSGLSIKANKDTYNPGETATFTISSQIKRDIFLSFERERVNRYQIVHLTGASTTVDVPLVDTDMPNIFAYVSSFSDSNLDSASENILVSANNKRLNVTLTPDRKTHGPSDVMTINVATTDMSGIPISADTAVWAVDKALFELVDNSTRSIFETFWQERYHNTQSSHSLEGISMRSAEGGGCFVAGTPVLMANGEEKPIETIRAGDYVLTRKFEHEPSLIQAKVAGTHKRDVDGYFLLNGNLKVTPNHRLWVNETWREAQDIIIGDNLRDKNNQSIKVRSIEWQAGKATVYNLEIDTYRTYFAGGVWVHNQKGDGGARSVFKDTAYWNPAVHTDLQGRAQVSFKLPDNLTTWVIASIGSTTDTKVGQATAEVVVTKDIIVRPIVPNLMRTGDEVVLSALIQNFTGVDQKFDVDLIFSDGTVNTATYSGTLVKSKSTEQLYWKVHPDKDNEKSRLTFSARSTTQKNTGDSITVTLPVVNFGFYETRSQTGDGPVNFPVKLAKDADLNKSEVKLALAPTLLGTLPVAMKYLIDYPYGCVEQTTSRFVPAVIARVNADIYKEALKDKNIDEIIQKGEARLASLQQNDGGWSWWWSGSSDPFITAYVVEYLLEAKGAGITIDQNMLSRAQRYFEQESYFDAARNTRGKWEKTEVTIIRTYALGLLNSEIEKERTFKETELNNLTPDILALAVMVNVKHGVNNPAANGISQLISLAKPQGDGVYWEKGSQEQFGSQDASTAFAIRALVVGGGDRSIATKAVRFLTRNRKQNYWSNTFATAQIIRALTDYSRTGEELNPNYTYTVLLDGREISRGNVSQSKQTLPEIAVKTAAINPAGSTLEVKQNGSGQIYTTLSIREFHTDKNSASVSQGLRVRRNLVSEKGEGYSLAVGDVVTVNITVDGLEAEENYGVIADELPAGLVPVNQSFKNEQYGQNKSAYYTSYDVSDREITENGMVLSLYRLGGSHTYSYKARVVSEGIFTVPPAVATLMYAPEIYGRSASQVFKATKISEQLPISTPDTSAKPQDTAKPFDKTAAIVVVAFILMLTVVFIKGKVMKTLLLKFLGRLKKP